MLLKIAGACEVTLDAMVSEKPIKPEDSTSRALQKRFEIVKKLPPEKQKAFITLVDAFIS